MSAGDSHHLISSLPGTGVLTRLRGVGWPGSRAAALAPGSPAPHHEAQVPRANTALPSPQLRNEGEPVPRVKIPNIPWRVSFYSFDLRERRHVHVFRERMKCKVWIENNIEVAWNRGFAESEIHDI